MTTPFRTYTQALEGTVSMAVSPSGPTTLLIKGPTTGGNVPLLLVEETVGQSDFAIAQGPLPSQAVTMFNNGTLYTAVGIVSSGSFNATVDASGNVSIVDFGLGHLNGVPNMITVVSDVGGPCLAQQLSSAAGTYFLLNMDNSGNYRQTIEADGSITWGTGATQASTDLGLKRSAAGVAQVYGGNASSSIGTLNAALAQPYVTKSSAYTMTANDGIVNGNATSAAFTVTLPAANAVPAGRQFTVKKSDSSANAVTLSRAGTDTIEGVTTKALSTQFKYITVASDGVSEWWIIANN